MTDTAALIDDYIATWNETDPERRRELVTSTWAEDATYVDPLMSSEGPDGIDAMIANVQEQYPDHRFELVAGPDVHNDRVRFSWHLIASGGEPIALGIDFATISEDGRLREVTGLVERVN